MKNSSQNIKTVSLVERKGNVQSDTGCDFESKEDRDCLHILRRVLHANEVPMSGGSGIKCEFFKAYWKTLVEENLLLAAVGID
ncbi:hypothetical protein CDAR_230281 [Caerostris darwini]|uniref:Uncharacterized protein n=1 Tax=Caerostris darwini TaxID=1538125 RepID=A0AAV4MKG4_9ARAC|nr:hypothetical protein CDAR_230281 [Caerostris darwini]